MTTLEKFLLDSNYHELHELADEMEVSVRSENRQKRKIDLMLELTRKLDAKIATNPKKKEILKDFIRRGRLEAFAFSATKTPNLINGHFDDELAKHFDIVDHNNYTLYEPKDYFTMPDSLWYCKLKDTEGDKCKFIVFRKFLKKNTIRIAEVTNTLMNKFGYGNLKPLLDVNIAEIFTKLQNKKLQYTHSNYKMFYSSHVAKNRLITSSTHLSSGNEKVTQDLQVNDGNLDDLNINYFVKHENVIDDMELLDYMVIKANNSITENLIEMKVNIVNNDHARYKVLVSGKPTILHTYNIDTTIDDILLIIKYLNDIK